MQIKFVRTVILQERKMKENLCSHEAMEGLLTRGYEFGQSRVIAGYHWQSDVDAGRMAGNVLYQLIRNHERFIRQLAKARAEFAEKTGRMK